MEKRNKIQSKLAWKIDSGSTIEMERSYMTSAHRKDYVHILKPIYEKKTNKAWPLVNDEDWTNENIEKLIVADLYLPKELTKDITTDAETYWAETETNSGIFWPTDDMYCGRIDPFLYIDAYLWGHGELKGKNKSLWLEFLQLFAGFIEYQFDTYPIQLIGKHTLETGVDQEALEEINHEYGDQSPFYDFTPGFEKALHVETYKLAGKTYRKWDSKRALEIKHQLSIPELAEFIEKVSIYDCSYQTGYVQSFSRNGGSIFQLPWTSGCFDDTVFITNKILEEHDAMEGRFAYMNHYIGIDQDLQIHQLIPAEPLQEFEKIIDIINKNYSYAYAQKEHFISKLKRFSRICKRKFRT